MDKEDVSTFSKISEKLFQMLWSDPYFAVKTFFLILSLPTAFLFGAIHEIGYSYVPVIEFKSLIGIVSIYCAFILIVFAVYFYVNSMILGYFYLGPFKGRFFLPNKNFNEIIHFIFTVVISSLPFIAIIAIWYIFVFTVYGTDQYKYIYKYFQLNYYYTAVLPLLFIFLISVLYRLLLELRTPDGNWHFIAYRRFTNGLLRASALSLAVVLGGAWIKQHQIVEPQFLASLSVHGSSKVRLTPVVEAKHGILAFVENSSEPIYISWSIIEQLRPIFKFGTKKVLRFR